MANERTTQRIASAADPDIQLIQEGDVAAVTADFLVVQAENLDLAANPTVTVRLFDNGVPHILGTHAFDYTYPNCETTCVCT